MTPLKPCPFCGSENISSPEITMKWACACCKDCGARAGRVYVGHGGDPVAAWNTRATPAITDEDVERAIEAFGWPIDADDAFSPPKRFASPMRAALTAYEERKS